MIWTRILASCLLTGILLSLGACATPADTSGMIVAPTVLEPIRSRSPFTSAIAIKQVSGGEETNPLWTSEIGLDGFREALRASLANAGLLSPPATAKYDLTATLHSADQPLFGFDMTVTTRVSYVLEERKPFRLWYENTITAPFTATGSDSLLGFVRLKRANEGSARENIQIFLNELMKTERPVQ